MTRVLGTRRLVLDAPRRSDIQTIFALCQDAEIRRWIPIASPFALSDAEFFIDAYVPHGVVSGDYTTWAVRERRHPHLIGVIELRRDVAPGSASFGCWMGSAHRGRGYAREALLAVVDHAFSHEGLALTQLRWQGIRGNVASARLARSMGFRLETNAATPFPFRGEERESWVAARTADEGSDPKPGWPEEYLNAVATV
ncbi:GNAT family N-acetyltransferase [Microbacterium sp. STN6]|uniref:GNAT family N-acetyltransferase n=1 Tax=Microbacterium sp. STN6 TaxID=2995588 RepID=UPI00226091A9|nr:GNAT family N-acetyltransferase [Microbacterium sp. STN6]MCX7521621.1 GNAT family N-acetyltransferase [Microbacterium sp. STN6]